MTRAVLREINSGEEQYSLPQKELKFDQAEIAVERIPEHPASEEVADETFEAYQESLTLIGQEKPPLRKLSWRKPRNPLQLKENNDPPEQAIDRFIMDSQIGHLRAKYFGTRHADLKRYEWGGDIPRHSYASYGLDHPSMAHFSIDENESIQRERYNFMQGNINNKLKDTFHPYKECLTTFEGEEFVPEDQIPLGDLLGHHKDKEGDTQPIGQPIIKFQFHKPMEYFWILSDHTRYQYKILNVLPQKPQSGDIFLLKIKTPGPLDCHTENDLLDDGFKWKKMAGHRNSFDLDVLYFRSEDNLLKKRVYGLKHCPVDKPNLLLVHYVHATAKIQEKSVEKRFDAFSLEVMKRFQDMEDLIRKKDHDEKFPVGVLETVIDLLGRESDLLKGENVNDVVLRLVSVAMKNVEERKNKVQGRGLADAIKPHTHVKEVEVTPLVEKKDDNDKEKAGLSVNWEREWQKLNHDLVLQEKLLAGYCKALKENRRSFLEYRARNPHPAAAEPLYQDVGFGGFVHRVGA